MTAATQLETSIAVPIFEIERHYQTIRVALQNIVHAQSVCLSTIDGSSPFRLPLSEIGRCLPRLYANLGQSRANIDCMAEPERDANRDALRQVEHATDSQPVKGEELLQSDDLKRELRKAKERLTSDSEAN